MATERERLIYEIQVQLSSDDPAFKALQAELARVDRAMQDVQKSSDSLGKAKDRVASASKRLTEEQKQAQREVARFGQRMQNAGYQVGDFFTQVGGGVDVFRALGQQLPQVLVGFGALGAGLGVVASVIPLVMDAFEKASSIEMPEFSKQTDVANKAIQAIGKTSEKFDLEGLREEYNKADKDTRKFIRAQVELRVAIAQAAVDLANSKFAEEMQKIGAPLLQLIPGFQTTGKNLADLSLRLGLVGQDSITFRDVMGQLAGGAINAEQAFMSLQPILQRYGTEAQALANTLGAAADAQIVQNKAIADGKKYLEDIAKAGGKDLATEKGTKEAARKAEQERKEFVRKAEADRKEQQRRELEEYLRGVQVMDQARKEWEAKQLASSRTLMSMFDADEGNNAPEALDRYTEALQKQAQALNELADPMAKYRRELQELDALRPYLTVEAYNKALADLKDKTFTAIYGTSQLTKEFQSLAQQGIGGFVDQLLSADRSFSKFAEGFLRQIAAMIIRQQIFNALAGTSFGNAIGIKAAPSAKGNSFSGGTTLPTNSILTSPHLFKFASGGVFGGRLGVAGEAGPEAVVPLRRTTGGNLGVAASPTTINVYNQGDNKVDVEERLTPDGGRIINIMVRQEMRGMFADGSMDKILSSQYGLKRKGI